MPNAALAGKSSGGNAVAKAAGPPFARSIGLPSVFDLYRSLGDLSTKNR